MNEAPSTTGQEGTSTRVFDAPREELWKYFTEPEYFRDVVRDAAVHDAGLDRLDGR